MTSTTPTEPEALAAILHVRFPYIDQRDINRPVTVHWFDVIRAIETALSTPAARMLAGEGEAARLLEEIDRELRGPPGSPDNRRKMLAEAATHIRSAHPPAAEPVKRIEDGHADTEGEANAMFEHQNCPACGGSGHVDDVAAEPVAWQCSARKQGSAGGNEPADCDWPFCGCDPGAAKVLDAVQESGCVGASTSLPVSREQIIEAMRDDPYWNDALGTTDHDARLDHYADAIAAKFTVPATPARTDDKAREADWRKRMVRLDACPVGLFWSGGVLCVKTEYCTAKGAMDAYIVSSGEFFWGEKPQTAESQAASMVVPVDIDFAERVLDATADEIAARTDDAGVGGEVRSLVEGLRKKYIRRARNEDQSRKERSRCSHYVQALDEVIAALSPAPDRGEGEA